MLKQCQDVDSAGSELVSVNHGTCAPVVKKDKTPLSGQETPNSIWHRKESKKNRFPRFLSEQRARERERERKRERNTQRERGCFGGCGVRGSGGGGVAAAVVMVVVPGVMVVVVVLVVVVIGVVVAVLDNWMPFSANTVLESSSRVNANLGSFVSDHFIDSNIGNMSILLKV